LFQTIPKPFLKKNLPVTTGLICLLLIWSLTSLRHFVYFKDYGIIWEAAYRIYLGQTPFIDFSTPVGPGSFLIPALFFKIFGPTWHSLQLSQLFQSSILLLCGYYILKKTGVKERALSISIIFFTLLYLIFLSHPWYNSTATLFFFISLAIILTQKRYSFFIAGIFSGFSFLTKQDVGIINLFAICIISILMYQDIKKISYRLLNIIIFLFGMLFVISSFANFIGLPRFSEWLLMSLKLSLQRGNGLEDLFKGMPLLILGLICLKYFFEDKKKLLLYASILYFAAFISVQTKALFFTNFFYTLFSFPIVTYFIHTRNKLISVSVTILISFSLFSPLVSLINLATTLSMDMPEPYSFKHDMVTKYVIKAPPNIKIIDNMWAPPDTFKAIKEIQQIFKEKYKESGSPPSILNLSEITPIYGELGVSPPKNFPLWFDPKLTISDAEANQIKKQIKESRFDIIIFQSTFGGFDTEFYGPIFDLLTNTKDYKRLSEDGYFSPSSSLSSCKNKKDCINHNFFIFLKN